VVGKTRRGQRDFAQAQLRGKAAPGDGAGQPAVERDSVQDRESFWLVEALCGLPAGTVCGPSRQPLGTGVQMRVLEPETAGEFERRTKGAGCSSGALSNRPNSVRKRSNYLWPDGLLADALRGEAFAEQLFQSVQGQVSQRGRNDSALWCACLRGEENSIFHKARFNSNLPSPIRAAWWLSNPNPCMCP
jgi:hypothetical protein